MIRRLRFKLVAASLLSLLAVLAVILSAAGALNYRQVVQSADSVLTVLSQNGADFPKSEPNSTQAPAPPQDGKGQMFSPELPYESRYFSAVFGTDGTLSSVDTAKIAAIDADAAAQYAQAALDGGKTQGFLDDYRYLVYTQDDGTHIIFLDCGRDLNTFRKFVLTSAAVALAGLLAVALLLGVLSARIVKPFSENYEKQKRFITDAGHELKTPLTIIDADAEVLAMDYGESEWLDDIRAQTARLADLTNSLIYLARMEEEPASTAVEFPLSDVVAETAEAFRAVARTHSKTLTADVQPMLTFCGDEKAIRRLVSVLLDNALKYSDDGGRIEVRLARRKNTLRLTVFNTAERVPRESIAHLFDRFYRADASRSSQTGGYGLGLSIALAIVNAHKGKITAATQDERSLLVTVTLPG